jgi:hypothetical protein
MLPERSVTVMTSGFLDALKAAAQQAESAETEFRREAARRIAALEQERAFSYRRLNLMRAVAAAVGPAESEDAAVAGGVAALRARLGWETDSEARSEVLSRFEPVVRALFACLEGELPDAAVAGALAEFEAWYAAGRAQPFWTLFAQELPELPLVER